MCSRLLRSHSGPVLSSGQDTCYTNTPTLDRSRSWAVHGAEELSVCTSSALFPIHDAHSFLAFLEGCHLTGLFSMYEERDEGWGWG